MNLKQLLRKIYRKFPKGLSEVWDFPGYQCGVKDWNAEIKKVFLCLDFTEACLIECQKFQPDLILTHHPFLFGKKSEVCAHDLKKAQLIEEIEQLNCPIYSFHTNYDKAEDGMNDVLISLLGFEKVSVADDGLMRLCKTPAPMSFDMLFSHLCDTFDFDHLDYINNDNRLISHITFIAGGGASEFMHPLIKNSDVYLSGDCAHHHRLDMMRYGINYIDLPHEVEEIGFLTGMKKALEEIDPSLALCCYSFERYFSLYLPKKA